MTSNRLKSVIFVGALVGSLVLATVAVLAMAPIADLRLAREEVASLGISVSLLAHICSAWLVAHKKLGRIAIVSNVVLSLGVGALCLVLGLGSGLFFVGEMRLHSPEPRCGMPIVAAMIVGLVSGACLLSVVLLEAHCMLRRRAG